MRPWRLAGFGAALVLGAGCVTLGSFETAEAVGAGRSQLSVEPSVWAVPLGDTGPVPLPNLAISWRHGLSDTIDLGFRLGVGGGELLSKFVLAGGLGEPTMAFAPTVGVYVLPGEETAVTGVAQVPLLIGLPLGANELVLSPKVELVGSPGARGGLLYGMGAGYAVRVSSSFRVLPEITVLYPAGGGNEPLAQAGVGLLFGGR